jgi:predicted transcriptional regulator
MKGKYEETLIFQVDQERFDIVDRNILQIVSRKSTRGTLNLAEKVGMVPKNLIARLDKHKEIGWIIVKSVPAKPKGRERVFEITEKGKKALETYNEIFEGFKARRKYFEREGAKKAFE